MVKKNADVLLVNEIGRLFRGHNIMEYKSPEDHLDIDAFYKAGAYASLYKSYGSTVDERKADDITVSILREAKPRKLFRYFKDYGMTIANPYRGIYYILDGVLFPTQIIVTGELDRKNHSWLQFLSGKLQRQDLEELLENVNQRTGKDRDLADSVLEVSVRANQELVKELRGDDAMCEALLEIMEPEILKIKEEVRAQAEEKGREKGEESGIITTCKDLGVSFIDTVERIAAKLNITQQEAEERVRKYW